MALLKSHASARATAAWPEFVLTSFEKRDTGAQVVIVNGFADVELKHLLSV